MLNTFDTYVYIKKKSKNGKKDYVCLGAANKKKKTFGIPCSCCENKKSTEAGICHKYSQCVDI